jgi:DNA-3-methyladenine glycosylase
MGSPPAGARSSFPREALAGSTIEAAGALLGSRLVQSRGPSVRVGRIVEIEAYVGEDDEASHARFGKTKRNAVMFGPPGHAYVYLVYGMYCCLNVVTEVEGRAAALLVRAVEPLEGLNVMRGARRDWARRRAAARDAGRSGAGDARRKVPALPAAALASGPGLVCVAFSIDRADNGLDLCDATSPLRLEAARPEDRALNVATGPRVGIGYAGEPWRSVPWRFWSSDTPAVSATHGRAR